jgi:hypothetical protein
MQKSNTKKLENEIVEKISQTLIKEYENHNKICIGNHEHILIGVTCGNNEHREFKLFL